MAKRLSKALRGKRRWFGIAFDSRFVTRLDLQKNLDLISQELAFSKNLRLMDFFNSNHEQNLKIEIDNFEDFNFRPFGLAIVEVPLEYSVKFRELVSTDSREELGLISLTSSGKISLVRQRLNLPKPKRRK
tara:strand:+ start:197 stop:589 length:393 start_codon:yes stop_codon:yes gene_type:complete